MDHHQHHQHHRPDPITTSTKPMIHRHSATNTTPTAMSMVHHHDHAEHSSHSMAMTFHAGFQEQILFDQWSTNSIGGFIGSCIVIFIVAVLYEGLKTIRDQLGQREMRRPVQRAAPENENNLLSGVKVEQAQGNRVGLLTTYHLIQTLLHILQMGISYLLMLIAMTFNIYLFLAVILGAGLGHFLFGWRRNTVLDRNEHCH